MSMRESFSNGYDQAIDELNDIYRDTEHLSDEELVDFIWQWVCDLKDKRNAKEMLKKR